MTEKNNGTSIDALNWWQKLGVNRKKEHLSNHIKGVSLTQEEIDKNITLNDIVKMYNQTKRS